MLYELLYTSCAARPMTAADLVALLDRARESNAKRNVTGILVYHNREFMQILEGEQNVVHELFERIALDDRHKSVRIFYEGPIQERAFGGWSMAFQDLDDLPTENLEGWSPFLEQGFSSEAIANDPSVAQKLLLSLRDTLVES